MVCCGSGGGRDGGEVDELVVVEAALAAGEREQRFDQTFLLLADREQLLAGVPVGLDAGVRIAESELEQRALERERRAQLVGGVGDELSLRLEGGLEPCEQSVDGRAELLELVVGSLERETAVEVAGGDLAGGVGDGAERSQGAAGDHPAEPERKRRHQSERNREGEEQLVQRRIRLPLRSGDRDLAVAGDRVRADRYREGVFLADDSSGAFGDRTFRALKLDHRRTAGGDEEVAGVLVVDEHVGDAEQCGGGAEKETAVRECQPQPDRRRRQTNSQPASESG